MLKNKSDLRNDERRDTFGLKIPSPDHLLTFAAWVHRLAWAGSVDQSPALKVLLCEVDVGAKEASGRELVKNPRTQLKKEAATKSIS